MHTPRHADETLINEDLAPVPLDKRTWTMWSFAALWISMAACIPTHMLASPLIDKGMNWWQAVLAVFLGIVIVLIPMMLNAHAGTKYDIPLRTGGFITGIIGLLMMPWKLVADPSGYVFTSPPATARCSTPSRESSSLTTSCSVGASSTLRIGFSFAGIGAFILAVLQNLPGFLDGFGGIVTVSVRHCHPDMLAAATLQNETISHTTTIYLNPGIALYAKELAAKMPGDLKVCYFVNSGSEANDLAVLMARAYTQNYDVISLRTAYHGGRHWQRLSASGSGHHAENRTNPRQPHSFQHLRR